MVRLGEIGDAEIKVERCDIGERIHEVGLSGAWRADEQKNSTLASRDAVEPIPHLLLQIWREIIIAVVPLKRLFRKPDCAEGQESTVRLAARAKPRATIPILAAMTLEVEPGVIRDALAERAEREELRADAAVHEPHPLDHLGSRNLSVMGRLSPVVLNWNSRRGLSERG